MKLIVGLGNPSGKYANNRHNVGFMAVDLMHDSYDFQPWRKRFSGELCEGLIGRTKCLMLKPSTYMNDSGRSVGEALRYYKIDLDDVIVLYDEIDLVAGKLKAKKGGGNAGHNGLRSLSSHIGNDYHRIRIGIGRPVQKSQVANHVLRDFSKADRVWLEPLLDAISQKMSFFLEESASIFLKEVAEHLAPLDERDSNNKPKRVRGKVHRAPKQVEQQSKFKSSNNQQKSDEHGALANMLKFWKKPNNGGE